ncbi:Molybdopterin biosynthesis protein MoeA / Periplasmic molybdate-binding domain protein [Methylophaga frappieri]|uniref:Molybdopterin biosynthesis protein MoeA / Periplasmic molybdate-binding domain protein n=1 Tax=Methylophaga frappieri (strain ATCC BAA-2434 / DSM 25690 / JAM7) TaxID=754477 RepID=I1YI66_METFJ|nr:substrate-binding domain-containing protein [Methylophaga frappieri]AFJ02609.1 Molybdopterin biosynthesis protein MoeA / Periplasmic molybdate-binding domain protein [Methylophaga frappieri]
MEFTIDFHWQLSHGNRKKAIDPVLIALLKSIEESGSLQAAAKQAQISYRYAWGLMEKWQTELSLPLIEKHRGRGTALAPAGQYFLRAHQQLQARLMPQLSNQATQLRQQLQQLQAAQQNLRLTLFASHGLVVNALRDRLNELAIPIDLHFHGSLENLEALKTGNCDGAGFHIPIGPLGQQLTPDYLALLDPNKIQLIYLVRRQQGLIVQAGNPKSIRTLSDLARADVHFINRQQGSATRFLLDQLLRQQAINSQQIQGYSHEEFTHMAIAAIVASGVADCGFGLAAVARKFSLDFLPLVEEHYCLALPADRLQEAPFQELIRILQLPEWQRSLADLAGYDLRLSGQPVSYSDIFQSSS